MKNVFLILTIVLFASSAFTQNCQNDTIPPVAVCNAVITTPPNANGGLLLTPDLLDGGSFDDCSPVILSLSPDLTDTMRVVFDTLLQLWVTDEAGNQSTCFGVWERECDPNFELTATIDPFCGDILGGSITLDFINSQNFSDYTYKWSTGDTRTNSINQLSVGTYSITLTDRFGCFYTQEFIVPHAIQLDKFTFPSCNDDGTALVLTDEVSNYDFIWSNGETSEGITDLPPGIYEVTITSGECIRIDSLEVESTIEIDIAVTYGCEGKGNIEITPQADTGELFYTWSNGEETSSLSDLETGTYTVTITDDNECVRIEQIEVEEYPTLEIVSLETFDNCDGTGRIFGEVSGGEKPYVYTWASPDGEILTTDSLDNESEGFYFLTIEDANGCTVTSSVELEVSPSFDVEIEVTANCEENTFNLETLVFESGDLVENISDYTFRWNTGQSSSIISDPRIGIQYLLFITNRDGCQVSSEVVSIPDNFYSESCNQKTLNGILFLDQNRDCHFASNSSEIGINFPVIEVALVKDTLLDSDLIVLESDFGAYVEGMQYTEQRFFRDGQYRLFFNIQKPYPSDYQYLKISTNFPSDCGYRYIPIATLLEEDVSLSNFDIPIQLDESCELLTVDISTPFLRRCFESTYYVNYCNRSSVEVENAYIEIQFDDFLDFTSSGLEATDLGDNLYRFDLGILTEGECGQFPIQVNVSCDALLGQTHCTSASIFPIPDCLDWSGAELQITAECEADSVLFTIENIGEEDMLTPSSYIAIEDVVAFSQGDFELGVQEKKELRFAKNGSTYRLRAQQVNGLPYPSQPTVALEGCGTNEVGDFSRSFVTQFSEDDAAIFTSIHCEENRGSYDPNDKQVFPKGVGALGQIEQNIDLEYKIRFQNTGTDTAFTVVILDTLSTWLDASSVQAGASSHPYIFEVLDSNVLRFQFNDILLPDSTTNLAASQGFVQFRVSQNVDVPLGETILNNAAIYFDFNEPIITNTVSNQLGKDFLQIISSISNKLIQNYKVLVSPNPLNQFAIIEIEGQVLTNSTFILYDFRGQEVRRQTINENKIEFYRKNLPTGGYFFKIVRHKNIINTGKLVVSD